MSKITIVTTIGEYGHFADIERVTNIKCDVCKEIGTNLAIDTSMGEYATLMICKPCIINIFKGDLDEENIRTFG